jgi:sulfide:quinone oxidoreductase
MTGADSPREVVIAGGGVAALEALIALRELAGDRVRTTLVAPETEFTYRPLTVTQPFALGHAERYPLDRIAEDFGARLITDAVTEVVPEEHRVRCASGAELPYDALVMTVGARTERPFELGITFGEPEAREALAGLLADLEEGYAKRVAFVVPPGTSWPLPLYELALMTAADVWGMGIDEADLTFVTPEQAPLGMFGTAASDAVASLLAEARIEFVGSSYASMEDRRLVLAPGHRVVEAAHVVTLPLLRGPALPGLPADPEGFIPVDDHGRVRGHEDVYAAGDATTFPIKQGGIATQMADTVAQTIAQGAGAPVQAAPMRPVLRGMLLTGGAKQFLRHAIAGGEGDGETAQRALWWPPHKVAGRYLAPYLFGRQEAEILHRDPGSGVAANLTLGGAPGTAGDHEIEILAAAPPGPPAA